MTQLLLCSVEAQNIWLWGTQALSGGSAERAGDSGRSRDGDSERGWPQARNGERDRERSRGAGLRRDGRDKPRDGHERGSRERDAREQEARGRDRKRDRADWERPDRERSDRLERVERPRGDSIKPERPRGGDDGGRRRNWGGDRDSDRERRRGSGALVEVAPPTRLRSPNRLGDNVIDRKRARSNTSEPRARGADSLRREPVPLPPPPARSGKDVDRGGREGGRSGSARGNGAHAGGLAELPPPPPLAVGISPEYGDSPDPPVADAGRRQRQSALEEEPRRSGVVQDACARAVSKVGLLRVGGPAADHPSSLGAQSKEVDNARKFCVGTEDEELLRGRTWFAWLQHAGCALQVVVATWEEESLLWERDAYSLLAARGPCAVTVWYTISRSSAAWCAGTLPMTNVAAL